MKVRVNRGKRKSSKKQLNKGKRKERKVVRALNESDVKKLRAACETEREKRILEIFLETGMHPEVMANPEAHEMEIESDRLMWNRPKTFKLCMWEYPPDKSDMVQNFIGNDLGYDPSTYWRWVKAISDRAGFKHVSPLTLRHTATVMLLKKMSPEMAQQRLRCAPQTLWNHYARLKGFIR
jgi:integrase